jgi:hypothetical protein
MPYTVAGSTVHFIAQYDTAMGAAGLAVGNAILAVCESQYASLSALFSGLLIPTVPITVQIENTTGGGANNLTNFIHISAGGVAAPPDSYQAQWILVAELSEIFMHAQGAQWNPSNSKGEGLSRLLAELAYPFAGDPTQMYQYATAYYWMNNGRQDFVSATVPSDTNPAATGCSILFIYYLAFQLGLPLASIIANNSTTLLGIYTALVGGTGGFAQFAALLNIAFPPSIVLPFTFPENAFPIGGRLKPQTYSFAQIAYRAYRHISGHRAGMVLSPDILNDIFGEGNDMLDEWLNDENMVFARRRDSWPLTAGVQAYTIGPGATFNGSRPTNIDEANVILTTSNPTVRKPVHIATASEFSLIAVQDIPFAIPLELWYDNNFSTTGTATINLWPGPLSNYQLELYTWQQLVQFLDTATPYEFPPGYASAIIWSLAERIIPMMQLYFKVSQPMVDRISAQAAKARATIQGKNQVDLMTQCDPAFLSGRLGAWSYLTGSYGRGL